MRTSITIFTATLAATLLAGALGCGRPANTTSNKGAGGFPIQKFDSSQNVIPWEIPADLVYPNWSQMYPDNNRIYLTPDSVEQIATWYTERLPDPVREDINGKRHIKIRNKEIEVDIESGGDKTRISVTPLTLGLAK